MFETPHIGSIYVFQNGAMESHFEKLMVRAEIPMSFYCYQKGFHLDISNRTFPKAGYVQTVSH